MERQRSFSIKSTRFLVFSLTISSSLIFLTFFFIWVVKSTPSVSIYQQNHIQLNQSVFNLTLEPVTVQSLTGFSRNFSGTNVKYLITTDTQFNGTQNTTGFLRSSDFNSKREKNDTQERDNRVKSSTSGVDRAPAVASSFEIEVQNDQTIEEETKAATVEKTELPSNQHIQKKQIRATSVNKIEDTSDEKIKKKRTRGCDITKGGWVYDESYPLYTESSCPFIDEGFNCMSNGRLDKDYMKLKWQPQDCDIPRIINVQ